MPDKTPQEIEKELLELPYKIWKFGQDFITAEKSYQLLEESAAVEFDVNFLKSKANNPPREVPTI